MGLVVSRKVNWDEIMDFGRVGPPQEKVEEEGVFILVIIPSAECGRAEGAGTSASEQAGLMSIAASQKALYDRRFWAARPNVGVFSLSLITVVP